MQITAQQPYSLVSAEKPASNLAAATAAPSAANTTAQASLTSYDFTNITPRQMLATINKLITSGQASVDETSALLPLMGAGVPGLASSASDGPDQPLDFINRVRQSIAYAQDTHNESGVAYGYKGLSLLERLQGTVAEADIRV